MTREEREKAISRIKYLQKYADDNEYWWLRDFIETFNMAIEALEQEPCDNVCECFEQHVDIATDIVEFRFSDGTVKRAKRGLYMRDIEKSIRKMLIDQMANEKKQEPKTGYWHLLDECSNSGYYCSECHKKVVKEGWSNTVKKIKFCPNCGAKMVKPQESEEGESK